MAKGSSSASAYTVSSGPEEEDYAPERSASPPPKRVKASPSKPRLSNGTNGVAKAKLGVIGVKGKSKAALEDIEDSTSILRPHGIEYHDVAAVTAVQNDLLDWFETVRDKRGMPWRKKYDPNLSMQEKGQRAYEIWVSEVMLQQTQVSTVIAYWKRWIEKWPTIADLAKADVEEVNAMWRGLGYYRRARSLLEGAKTVMSKSKYHGRLPSDPAELEKDIPGVGRYTAGAICSTAYGIRTPLVDGNVHRLLTRLLAIHAPQTAPMTIKLLWRAASELVDALPTNRGEGVAGDWNQALMELGSQVCKPVAPECKACPIRASCKAYAELSESPPSSNPTCSICEPIPSAASTIAAVTVFPMRKEKKVSREEEEVVCVVEWRSNAERRWLFTKRPDKGLLAGLFQPPTTPISTDLSAEEREAIAADSLPLYIDLDHDVILSKRTIASVPHIFSHINMVYHVVHLVMAPNDSSDPPQTRSTGVWLDAAGVESANIGTAVKKVWATIYGSWGSFELGKGGPKAKTAGKKRKSEVVDSGPRITQWLLPKSSG